MRSLLAALLLCLSTGAIARPAPLVDQFNGDRWEWRTTQLGPEVSRSMRCAPPMGCGRTEKSGRIYKAKRPKASQRVPVPRQRPDAAPRYIAPMTLAGGVAREGMRVAAVVLGGRPQGCPARFCGCGALLHLFGRIIPTLNLAANWLRFPRALPAPKMAAARRGHVFVLERHIAGNVWIVHDSNSGGRRTRLHARSIAGYVIVNPHGST